MIDIYNKYFKTNEKGVPRICTCEDSLNGIMDNLDDGYFKQRKSPKIKESAKKKLNKKKNYEER